MEGRVFQRGDPGLSAIRFTEKGRRAPVAIASSSGTMA